MVTTPARGISVRHEDSSIDIDLLAFCRKVGREEGRWFPKSLAAKLTPQQQKTMVQTGFRYRYTVELPAARYDMRVLVRDNIAKKIGTVSAVVDLTTSSP